MAGQVRKVETVLLVDDVAPMLNVWERDFARVGRRVAKATSYESAIEAAERARPDVAVVDLLLRGKSGFEVLRALKARAPDLFVILVSAHMTGAWARAGMKLGANHCYIKPFTASQVIDLVERGVEPIPDWNNPDVCFTLDRAEWEHICRALVESRNNVTRAAQRLGLHLTTLRRKLGKRGVLPLP